MIKFNVNLYLNFNLLLVLNRFIFYHPIKYKSYRAKKMLKKTILFHFFIYFIFIKILFKAFEIMVEDKDKTS